MKSRSAAPLIISLGVHALVVVVIGSWYAGQTRQTGPVKKPPALVRFVPSYSPLAEPVEKPEHPLETIEAPPLPDVIERARLTPVPRTTLETPGPKQWQGTLANPARAERSERAPSRLTPTLPPSGPAAAVQAILTTPELISRISPEYPKRCRKRGHEGAALLALDIDATGRVSAARLIDKSPCPRLDASARQTAVGLRFRPATENGAPVATTIELSIRFQLRARN